ncbi:hypothetical protein AM1_4170 [Acaryochloris marina MBIC11017]|uniref:Uncharacterized protein n=1 Tax=Acaryochloris marina (strain MBIC 11017) TaxID=329726 RepID=B0CBN2_ACAM1|nr:hypothetical protein AM1_4170 [Acaryochloris marina MBIC11017]
MTPQLHLPPQGHLQPYSLLKSLPRSKWISAQNLDIKGDLLASL